MAAPRRVLPLLLVAYAAFYLCRANVEPALNLLAVEQKYDNEQIGGVMAVALGVYAFGKLVLGPLADVWGGKPILLLSLLATALLSFSIAASDAPHRLGPAAGLLVVGALVVANRFVQAGGWGGLVGVVAVTFDSSRRGTIMGILATSYDVGNVVALLLSAAVVELGGSWRALFVINPAIVLIVAVVVKLALPDAPPAAASTPDASSASDATAPTTPAPEEGAASLVAIFARLAREPAFWFANGLSFLLTFVRAGFMTWTPRFLYEVSIAAHQNSPMSGSIAKSAFFGGAGIFGSVITGRLSDRLGPGRRTPLIAASLALLLVSTLGLAHAGVRSPVIATVGVAACGLFLLGPYSLLSGAISLDVAGKRGGATTAGVIDAIGYVGASVGAFAIGSVSKRAGWTAAFDVVASVTFVALVLALIWNARSTPRLPRPAASLAR